MVQIVGITQLAVSECVSSPRFAIQDGIDNGIIELGANSFSPVMDGTGTRRPVPMRLPTSAFWWFFGRAVIIGLDAWGGANADMSQSNLDMRGVAIICPAAALFLFALFFSSAFERPQSFRAAFDMRKPFFPPFTYQAQFLSLGSLAMLSGGAGALVRAYAVHGNPAFGTLFFLWGLIVILSLYAWCSIGSHARS